MVLRTDLADSGLYIMKHWVVNLIGAVENELKI